MLRINPLTNIPTTKLIFGLGLCAVGSGMLYVYFRTRDDDDDDENSIEVRNNDEGHLMKFKQFIRNKMTVSKHPKNIRIELKIKNEHVPILLGRDGINLRSIEEKTLTKITFRERHDSQVLCMINGFPDNVEKARSLLLQEIERSPTVTEEIYVPQTVTGKIIGRCGEAMQEICRVSLAKVSIDTASLYNGDCTRRILITGNRQQVNIACKLIEDKIEEDKSLRQTVHEIEQKRDPRRSPVVINMSSSLCSSENSLNGATTMNKEDNCMEVYVSAIATPSKFWVQLIGPQTKKLDDLVDSMTDYYNISANREAHVIQEPYLGQIVATIFKYDSKWYRAEIVGILPNQYNPKDVVLDLYFVDYGDNEYMSPNEIFELRTDFLTLRFQAVECFLANVQSTLLNSPETWEPQSIEAFEELTKVARWKKLISRLVTYKHRDKTTIGHTSIREGSPVPGVELYDIQDGVEVNLGLLLISNGFALPINDFTNCSAVVNVQNGTEAVPLKSFSQDNTQDTQINQNNCQMQNPIVENVMNDTEDDEDVIYLNNDSISSAKITPTQFKNNNNHQQINGTSTQWQLSGNISR